MWYEIRIGLPRSNIYGNETRKGLPRNQHLRRNNIIYHIDSIQSKWLEIPSISFYTFNYKQTKVSDAKLYLPWIIDNLNVFRKKKKHNTSRWIRCEMVYTYISMKRIASELFFEKRNIVNGEGSLIFNDVFTTIQRCNIDTWWLI